ncbi:PKD domain-containing protein [candidate division KSB1 bacterium]|nr:PKD domain-containing protein [candidate division KSB1 bacterium]
MQNCYHQNHTFIFLFVLCVLGCVFFITHSLPASCTANFIADTTSGCTPLTVVFYDKSQNATTWFWDFPGGNPSSASSKGPHTVTYAAAGTYNVKLDIVCPNAYPGKNTIIKDKYITVSKCPCEAEFVANKTIACVGEEIIFTDQSTDAICWQWSFPGGTPSSAQTQGPHKVKYNKPGDYSVTLEVDCANGSDKETKINYIHINDCSCDANFSGSPTSGLIPLKVTFTDNSPDATDWQWTFEGGEPQSAQGKGPHDVVYYNEGRFDVKLEIQCASGTDILVRDDYIFAYFFRYDFGDAPEDALAYPDLGIDGKFPTCKNAGPAGYIRHHDQGDKSYFGSKVDYELDGNAGYCPSFNPDSYNKDESSGDGDCGIVADIFTIQGPLGSEDYVPIISGEIDSIGYAGEIASWGRNLNLWFNTEHEAGAYVNVLIDWNRDGEWGDVGPSPLAKQAAVSEHILKNFKVPLGNGYLSALHPPDFQIGDHPGFVWARFTITNEQIIGDWTGEGDFTNGETEDHLIWVGSAPMRFDFGDAMRWYRTYNHDMGAVHRIENHFWLGDTVDADLDGMCDPQALGDDKDGIDDEDGVRFLTPLEPGQQASVEVRATTVGALTGWIDFNADSSWDDPGEHFIIDYQTTAGVNVITFTVPVSATKGQTFARFRFSDVGGLNYFGPYFDDQTAPPIGEVEDCMVTIGQEVGIEYSSPESGLPQDFRLSQNYPNPFNPSTEFRYSLPYETHVRIAIYNLVGKEIYVLMNEQKPAGEYMIRWNGRDANGNLLSTGIYMCTMKTDVFQTNRKLILMK